MGILDTALNYWAKQKDQALTRETNQLNYNMWQQQLDYDRPVNQVARLKEAGLNPALMYGTGSGANVAPSAPRMESPRMGGFDGRVLDPGAVVALQQSRLLGEQARALKLENDQNDPKTGAPPDARKGDSAPVRAIRQGVDSFRQSELGRHVGPTMQMMKSRGPVGVLKDAWNYWFPNSKIQDLSDLIYTKPKDRGGVKK